jgi:hypothetical protein
VISPLLRGLLLVETVQVGLTEEKSKKAAALQLCQQRGEPDPKGPCR